MSYSNGLLQSNNTNITPIKGPRGEKGDPGVGFDVTPEGNFNLNKKRVIGLKTPDDVAIDDSIENYSRDLETAVNKRYLNQFFLKKNRNETVFDCAGLSLQNTEVYYPSLYNDRSVPNVGYVSVEDNKVRTEIDTKLATKADKSYADNTYLTKKSGGVLAQSLQNKADKSYVDNTFLKKVVGRVLTQKILSKLDIDGSNSMQANLKMGDHNITNLKEPINDGDAVNKKYMLDHTSESHVSPIDQKNVFDKIMTDQYNQLSEENDIELGDTIEHPNPVHQINKKVIDAKLLLDSSKNYYSSRLGICNSVQLSIQPPRNTFLTGTDLQLLCKCYIYPLGTYTWTKNSVPVVHDGRVTVSQNKLLINNATEGDSGKYECKATTKDGSTTKSSLTPVTVTVIVWKRPQFQVPPPKEVVVLEGSQTLIPCKAVGSPVPVINWYTTYYRGRWYRLRDNSKYTIHENGSLVIRNVNNQGTLKYKCVAYNLVARIGAETMVKVAYLDDVVLKRTKLYVLHNHELEVYCKPRGVPEPTITWQKADNQPLPKTFAVEGCCTLKKNRTKLSDSGNYTRIAKNMLGTKSRTIEIIVSGELVIYEHMPT
ncbi:hypothetical protein ACROYT_G039408 [Oculina patagonica]